MKIKDLMKYLKKNKCEIDTFFYDFINEGIDDRALEGNLKFSEIMNMDIDGKIFKELKKHVLDCFGGEFNTLLLDCELEDK